MSSVGLGIMIGLAIYGMVDLVSDIRENGILEDEAKPSDSPTFITVEEECFGVEGQTVCYTFKTDRITTNIYPN